MLTFFTVFEDLKREFLASSLASNLSRYGENLEASGAPSTTAGVEGRVEGAEPIMCFMCLTVPSPTSLFASGKPNEKMCEDTNKKKQ